MDGDVNIFVGVNADGARRSSRVGPGFIADGLRPNRVSCRVVLYGNDGFGVGTVLLVSDIDIPRGTDGHTHGHALHGAIRAAVNEVDPITTTGRIVFSGDDFGNVRFGANGVSALARKIEKNISITGRIHSNVPALRYA